MTCHHGSSLHYGHYTSYVRGPDGAWFNADDDDVSPVNIKTVLDDRAAYLLSYMRVGKGEKAPSAPPTPAARTESAPSSPAVKRRRDDSPPAPAAKRASVGGAVASARRPLVAVYGTTSDRRAKPSPLALDKYASGEEEGSDSDGLDAKVNKLARPRATPPADVNVLHPRPRALQLAPNAVSPIARPKNPSPAASASASTSAAGSAPGSPCSPRKLKGKFHRANPKHGVDARSHPHSHSHSHSHKGHHKRKPNALNPFAAGHAKPRSNARFNLAGREVSLPRKKGIIRNMRPRGL